MFENTQDARFIKAPFDTVLINGDFYLQPMSFKFDSQGVGQTSSTDGDQSRLARQNGYYTDLNPIVVEEHEMGADGAVAWKSLNRFGFI